MRVYHDFFFGTRIQINVSWYGSGSGQMIRIRPNPDPDPDPKHCLKVSFLHDISSTIDGLGRAYKNSTF